MVLPFSFFKLDFKVAALLFVLITAAGLAWIFLNGPERWDEIMGLIHNGTVAVAA